MLTLRLKSSLLQQIGPFLHKTRCFNYYTIDKCAKEAAKRGHLGILNLVIEKNANKWDWIAKNLAEGGGHLGIFNLLIERVLINGFI